MPFHIEKSDSKWLIVRSDTGEVVGHSDTLAKAKASIRYRMEGADETYTPVSVIYRKR
jgi:hypothetical protein